MVKVPSPQVSSVLSSSSATFAAATVAFLTALTRDFPGGSGPSNTTIRRLSIRLMRFMMKLMQRPLSLVWSKTPTRTIRPVTVSLTRVAEQHWSNR